MRPSELKTLQIVREYIDPGARVVGSGEAVILCPHPEHFDRNRSNCSINLKKQVWNCFSCGATGTLKTALKFFEVEGVSLPTVSPLYQEQVPEVILPEHILYAYEYHADPWIKDGFLEEVLDDNNIGYDIHNRRITIPLYNEFGELVGISGRATLEGQIPKYKIYKKELGKHYPFDYSPKTSNHLWRYHKIKDIDGPIIVTEGFKQAMWLVQAGYDKAVALCGSNMTEAQTRLLIKHNKPVLLFLDMDEAGRKGSKSSEIRLRESGLDVSIIDYEYRQPDAIPFEHLHIILKEYV